MALPKTELLFTIEEYLAMEREADERHEYLDGVIYAMAGETRDQIPPVARATASISQTPTSPFSAVDQSPVGPHRFS